MQSKIAFFMVFNISDMYLCWVLYQLPRHLKNTNTQLPILSILLKGNPCVSVCLSPCCPFLSAARSYFCPFEIVRVWILAPILTSQLPAYFCICPTTDLFWLFFSRSEWEFNFCEQMMIHEVQVRSKEWTGILGSPWVLSGFCFNGTSTPVSTMTFLWIFVTRDEIKWNTSSSSADTSVQSLTSV